MEIEALLSVSYTVQVERPWTDLEDGALEELRYEKKLNWGTVAHRLQRNAADVVNRAECLLRHGKLTTNQKDWVKNDWNAHSSYVQMLT